MKHAPEYSPLTRDVGSDVLDRLTVDWLLTHLTDEQRDILYLWAVEERTLADIGRIVGLKYRGRALTGSVIAYHKKAICKRLQEYRADCL